MSVTIEQLRDVAWYCENARDTEDMIQCLESIGICWESGDELVASGRTYETIINNYAFLLSNNDRLLYDPSVYVGQKLLRRSRDGRDIPLISWTELHSENRESVSLSEYLFSSDYMYNM